MRLSSLTLVLLLLAYVPDLRAASPATDGYFKTTDGARLHYLDSGRGPPIVFIPGWTMPGKIWQSQIVYFSQSHRVIALDPRSQGESQKTSEGNYPERRARDTKELVDHLGLPKVVLVGWSLGVRENLTYAQLFGTSSLAALVLVDGDVLTATSTEAYQAHADFLHRVAENRVDSTRAFVQSMYKKPQSERYLAGITAESLKTPTNTAVALLAELYLRNDLRPILAKLDVPLLFVVRGQHRDQAETARAVLPSAITEVFDDAGHALFVDDADRFNQVLDQFLTRISPLVR